jgi:hypothetical protein
MDLFEEEHDFYEVGFRLGDNAGEVAEVPRFVGIKVHEQQMFECCDRRRRAEQPGRRGFSNDRRFGFPRRDKHVHFAALPKSTYIGFGGPDSSIGDTERKPACRSALRAAKASSVTTTMSRSFVIRGRPLAANAAAPITAWGTFACLSARKARRACSAKPVRRPVTGFVSNKSDSTVDSDFFMSAAPPRAPA